MESEEIQGTERRGKVRALDQAVIKFGPPIIGSLIVALAYFYAGSNDRIDANSRLGQANALNRAMDKPKLERAIDDIRKLHELVVLLKDNYGDKYVDLKTDIQGIRGSCELCSKQGTGGTQ